MAVSALEQLVLELINRARLDPAGEAARYGISLNEGLPAGKLTASAKQPLVLNSKLSLAAERHSQHMINVDKFAHDGIGDGTPGSRMQGAGYAFTGAWTRGENIAFRGTTATYNHEQYAAQLERDLFVDAGYAGRGHRLNILKDNYKEAGIGLVNDGAYTINGTTYKAAMLTQDFAATGTDVFVTGVAINDTDRDNFYDIGEARANVTVSVMSGATLLGRGVTSSAGGYSAGIDPTSGPVTVTFTGGGLPHAVTATVASAGQNVKMDLSGTNKVLSSASTTLGSGASGLVLLGVASLSGTGNSGANSLTGNKGANSLSGADGSDTLDGKGGTDSLYGGNGRDILIGGSGNDYFRFRSVGEAGNSESTRDVIMDMHKTSATGLDHVHLQAIDAKAGEGTDNDTFTFIATKGAAFTGIGQIRWVQQNPTGTASDKTIIFGNMDHDLTTSEFQIEIRGLVTLAAGDFVL